MSEKFRENTRATLRAAAALPLGILGLGLMAVQAFAVLPLTGNNTVIPNLLYRTMGKLLGLKVEFNKASAPLVKDKPVWYVMNHLSIADFIVAGSVLNATFAGKGEILKWRFVGQMAKAVKYIGLRRTADKNPESRAKIIKNFNAGYNLANYPEATTTDGKKVALFRAPLFTPLFGEKGVDKEKHEVALDKEVVVQPIAIRVKTVDGQNAIGNDDLREKYAKYYEERTLKRIWDRLKTREITIELTAFPALKPSDYAADADPLTNAKALINKAALEIVSVVNPGQTTFEKAAIPGQPVKPASAPVETLSAPVETPKAVPAPVQTPQA